MADCLDFFCLYIIGSIEIMLHFCFFIKVLNKKVVLPFYFLFTVCSLTVLHFLPTSTMIRLGVFFLLLALWGKLLCRAELKLCLFYAALAVEIMQLCYGITRFLSYILAAPFVAYEVSGLIFMLVSEIVSLIFAGICYYAVYRHFSSYTATETQYMFIVFIPLLMIFIMDEYINYIVFGWEYIYDDGTTEFIINHVQTLILHLLGLASLFCILFAHKKLLQSFRLRTELTLLEQKEHSLNQYVEEARSHYEKTKAFRHDIKNHITIVKKLLQGGKTEDAIDRKSVV